MDPSRSDPMRVPIVPETGGHVGGDARSGPPLAQPWMDECWSEKEAIAFRAALEAAEL
jgi:hypothetical protein